MEALRVLGIDPGSRHTGYGVIEKRGSRLRVLAHGRISPDPKGPMPQRLAALATGLREVIASYGPTVAALETPFHGINSRTLIVLAQARGALMATLALDSLQLFEYAPAEVKVAVSGNGRATKEQVARMVEILLGVSTEGWAADATDAVAVAICCARRLRMDRIKERSKKGHKALKNKGLGGI